MRRKGQGKETGATFGKIRLDGASYSVGFDTEKRGEKKFKFGGT